MKKHNLRKFSIGTKYIVSREEQKRIFAGNASLEDNDGRLCMALPKVR